ncbi:hypothetical protein DFH27DRAFT_528901 [Peziza echinospora]|nr:hypothetical protein DFH27DRAFT_528901 [Peziza echinospora]
MSWSNFMIIHICVYQAPRNFAWQDHHQFHCHIQRQLYRGICTPFTVKLLVKFTARFTPDSTTLSNNAASGLISVHTGTDTRLPDVFAAWDSAAATSCNSLLSAWGASLRLRDDTGVSLLRSKAGYQAAVRTIFLQTFGNLDASPLAFTAVAADDDDDTAEGTVIEVLDDPECPMAHKARTDDINDAVFQRNGQTYRWMHPPQTLVIDSSFPHERTADAIIEPYPYAATIAADSLIRTNTPPTNSATDAAANTAPAIALAQDPADDAPALANGPTNTPADARPNVIEDRTQHIPVDNATTDDSSSASAIAIGGDVSSASSFFCGFICFHQRELRIT